MVRVTILNWERYNEKRKDVTKPGWLRVEKTTPQSQSLFGICAEHRYVFLALLCLACDKQTAELEIDLEWFSHFYGAGLEPGQVMEAIEALHGRVLEITFCDNGEKYGHVTRTSRARDEDDTLRTDERTDGDMQSGGARAAPSHPLLELWNEHRGPELPECKAFTGKRIRAAGQRWKENSDPAYWTEVIGKIRDSPFCQGKNDRKWKANIEWFLRPDVHVRVAEGQFDGGDGKQVTNFEF